MKHYSGFSCLVIRNKPTKLIPLRTMTSQWLTLSIKYKGKL